MLKQREGDGFGRVLHVRRREATWRRNFRMRAVKRVVAKIHGEVVLVSAREKLQGEKTTKVPFPGRTPRIGKITPKKKTPNGIWGVIFGMFQQFPPVFGGGVKEGNFEKFLYFLGGFHGLVKGNWSPNSKKLCDPWISALCHV